MTRSSLICLAVSILIACSPPPPSGGGGGGGGTSCTAGVFTCHDGNRRLCADNGRSWASLPCEGQTVCHEGQCLEPNQVPEAGPATDSGAGRADGGQVQPRADATVEVRDAWAPSTDSGVGAGDAGPIVPGDVGPPVDNAGLHLRLTWDHASSDVDIHLLRGGQGASYTTDQDCYYLNCNTARNNGAPRLAWGPGDQEDDPRLDLDDVNGFGPEIINLPELEANQPYLVAAYYYRADGTGAERASTATMQIWMNGVMVRELTKVLPDTQAWWEVAVINLGANPEVRVVDRLSTRPPGG